MKAEFLQPAALEAEEAKNFYDMRQSGLGTEFRIELDAALGRIEKMPLGWPLIDVELRKCRFNRFPYKLIYAVETNRIIIVAVAHDRRRPNYWRDRP